LIKSQNYGFYANRSKIFSFLNWTLLKTKVGKSPNLMVWKTTGQKFHQGNKPIHQGNKPICIILYDKLK